nr:hypothetical protein 7 [bacterium]
MSEFMIHMDGSCIELDDSSVVCSIDSPYQWDYFRDEGGVTEFVLLLVWEKPMQDVFSTDVMV